MQGIGKQPNLVLPQLTQLKHEVELSPDPPNDSLVAEYNRGCPRMGASEAAVDDADRQGIRHQLDAYLKRKDQRYGYAVTEEDILRSITLKKSTKYTYE